MRTSILPSRSFDSRTMGGSSTATPARCRGAMIASAITNAASPEIKKKQTGAEFGIMPAMRAAGTTTAVTQKISLERGTIMVAESPWNGYLLQDLIDHFRDRQSFDFKFRPQYDAMLQHRNSH